MILRFGKTLVHGIALAAALTLALAPARLMAATSVIAPTGMLLDVDVGKGVILRLDRPAGNVFVADPNVADVQIKSPTVIYLLGKAAGTTTLFALDKQDQVLLNSPVEVHSDNLGLQRALQQLIPGTDVRARSVNDSIVLEGTVKSAAEGDDIRKIAARYVPNDKQLVNEMQLAAPNQINLHVRIAEVSRNVVKQFGIDWFTAANTGAAAFGLVPAATAVAAASTNVTKIAPFLPGFNSGSTAPQFFNTQGSALIGSGSPGNLFGGVKVGSKSVDALVTALEDEGLVTMLAEPNLTAVSGQKASFLAGGEFPVPVPQSGTGGGAVVTIDYKQFGVSLSFIATMLSGNRISLHVEPEVSQIDTSTAIQVAGVNVPGVSTRRAETTVELASGQTFAIGGLMSNNVTQQMNKFPWLGDIPILGQLFRSEAFQRNESELVILVTPYVVRPVSEQMAMPTDGLMAPTDSDMILRSMMNGASKNPPTRSPSTPPVNPAAGPAAMVTPDGRKAGAPLGQVGFELD